MKINRARKRNYLLFLLLTFCFTNITFGGFIFSSSKVFLHKNHYHIYKSYKSNELDETNNEDSDSIANINLVALSSSSPVDTDVYSSKVESFPFLITKNSYLLNHFKTVTFSVFLSDKNKFCNTNLFLINSSYLI